MTPEQRNNQALLEQKNKEFAGKSAHITDRTHPHYGATCTIVGFEKTGIGYGLKMHNPNSAESFFVFKQHQFKIL